MNFISKEASQRIREEYPVGARVELTKMSDPYRTDLVPGCKGTRRTQCSHIFVRSASSQSGSAENISSPRPHLWNLS